MARASVARRFCTTAVIRVRSRVCSAAANAVIAAAPSPSASAQRPISSGPEPLSAAVRAPRTAASTPAAMVASRSRPDNNRDRSIGASISQEPSAADTSTGPNNRPTPSASPSRANQVAHGTSVRADRQDTVEQLDIVDWACSTRLVIIAPIISTLKIAT